MKLRYLFLIFIVAVLLAGWAGRTQLAELAIVSAMQSAGRGNISADISQLDPDQSHIRHLGLSFIDEKTRWQLDARNIDIRYNLEQLLSGRVNSISIDNLVVHHEDTAHNRNETTGKNPQQESGKPLILLAALQQALAKHLFFNTFSVQHFTLHGESFSVLQDKPLGLHSSNSNGTLTAKLALLNPASAAQQNDLRQLVISSLSPDTLSAELRFSAAEESVPAKLELDVHHTDKSNTVISGNYQLSPVQLQRWLQPFVNIDSMPEAEKVNGTLSFDFVSDEKIMATLTAATDKLSFNTYHADHVFIKLKTGHAAADPLQQIELQNGSYIQTSNLTFDSYSLAASRLFMVGELSASSNGWQYKGGFRSEPLAIKFPSQTLHLEQLAAGISANTEMLKINGDFSPATLPGKFDFTLTHNFSNGHGQLNINPLKPLDLNVEHNRLSQIVTPWPYPFDLLTGKITVFSQATWSTDKDFRLTAKLKLDDGGGTLAREIVFSGLYFDHELELLPTLQSAHTGDIHLDHLDSGIITSNLSTRLTLNASTYGALPQLLIQQLHGEIFGGSFSADDFVYNPNTNKNRFTISATNIDLAEIVKTQQLENLSVTGRVDGSIPIEINERGIFIEHGALVNAVRAGTIRYDAGAGNEQLKQNPLTGIALDALKDFRYSHLSADVNFTPEGLLTVNLQLKGTSPELDTDRPVHLNINTEQNLITLLKSLRFAQGVSDNIDKRVRQQYEQSRSNN